jgi:signal transduction protein with GAF and PtsI domain
VSNQPAFGGGTEANLDTLAGSPVLLSIASTSLILMTSVADQDLATVLDSVLDEFDCAAGTIHRAEEGRLELVAQEGMPDKVLERVGVIPFGKGMGGLAAERREPVQLCNLQTDDADVSEPGARETGLEGTIAVPMFGYDDTLKGVLGVGKRQEYEFSAEEAEGLLALGREIAERW